MKQAFIIGLSAAFGVLCACAAIVVVIGLVTNALVAAGVPKFDAPYLAVVLTLSLLVGLIVGVMAAPAKEQGP